MSNQNWSAAGAFGYEQAFIDGHRYVAGRNEGMPPGTGFLATQSPGVEIGVFATRDEAKAACVEFARGLGGHGIFGEIPPRYRPQNNPRYVG